MMEKLYNDFTTLVLPKLAEGLTITKEYFYDLFGRYVHYLIIKDAFYTGVGLLLLIAVLFIIYKNRKIYNDESMDAVVGFVFISVILVVISASIFLLNGNKLIKDVYIPEIRIYEELKLIGKLK